MLVRNRMTRNPITVSPTLPVSIALNEMRQKKVHRFPVVDAKGKLVGIVSQSDLLYAAPSSVTTLSIWEVTYMLNQIKVEDVMRKNVITVDDDCPIEEVARLMRKHAIGGVPVMKDGQLAGIITESDIFDVFLELLSASEPGIRLNVIAPYFKGSMAQIASAVTGAGGLIHALNSYRSEQPDTWGCVLKVGDITRQRLVEVVSPFVIQILDAEECRD